jgi:hypothetical protein
VFLPRCIVTRLFCSVSILGTCKGGGGGAHGKERGGRVNAPLSFIYCMNTQKILKIQQYFSLNISDSISNLNDAYQFSKKIPSHYIKIYCTCDTILDTLKTMSTSSEMFSSDTPSQPHAEDANLQTEPGKEGNLQMCQSLQKEIHTCEYSCEHFIVTTNAHGIQRNVKGTAGQPPHRRSYSSQS